MQKGILITVGVALAGMALGRIVSAMVDARTPFYPNWFYFIVEAVAAAALFAVASADAPLPSANRHAGMKSSAISPQRGRTVLN